MGRIINRDTVPELMGDPTLMAMDLWCDRFMSGVALCDITQAARVCVEIRGAISKETSYAAMYRFTLLCDAMTFYIGGDQPQRMFLRFRNSMRDKWFHDVGPEVEISLTYEEYSQAFDDACSAAWDMAQLRSRMLRPDFSRVIRDANMVTALLQVGNAWLEGRIQ